MPLTLTTLEAQLRDKAVKKLENAAHDAIQTLRGFGIEPFNTRLRDSTGKNLSFSDALSVLEQDIVTSNTDSAKEREVREFLAAVEKMQKGEVRK